MAVPTKKWRVPSSIDSLPPSSSPAAAGAQDGETIRRYRYSARLDFCAIVRSCVAGRAQLVHTHAFGEMLIVPVGEATFALYSDGKATCFGHVTPHEADTAWRWLVDTFSAEPPPPLLHVDANGVLFAHLGRALDIDALAARVPGARLFGGNQCVMTNAIALRDGSVYVRNASDWHALYRLLTT